LQSRVAEHSTQTPVFFTRFYIKYSLRISCCALPFLCYNRTFLHSRRLKESLNILHVGLLCPSSSSASTLLAYRHVSTQRESLVTKTLTAPELGLRRRPLGMESTEATLNSHGQPTDCVPSARWLAGAEESHVTNDSLA
jgi:hypothetical protein